RKLCFDALRPRPWTRPWLFLGEEQIVYLPAVPVARPNGDDLVRPGWPSNHVIFNSSNNILFAARSDGCHIDIDLPSFNKTTIDPQGVDGRTEQNAPLDPPPVIRCDLKPSAPASERFLWCLWPFPSPRVGGTRAGHENEGKTYGFR